MRKFRGNNYMKGRISHQFPTYVESGAIKFEKGEKRNTCIIEIDEKNIEKRKLDYIYNKLIPINREIKEDK